MKHIEFLRKILYKKSYMKEIILKKISQIVSSILKISNKIICKFSEIVSQVG